MKRFGLSLILATLIGLLFYFRSDIDIYAFQAWLKGIGVWAPVIFMLIYFFAPSLFLPGSLLTLAGGALFGPVWGSIYSLVAATAGATLAFLIARYLASDWAKKKSHGKLQPLMKGIEDEGWRFVAFVRLVPLFPFNFLNYALGLTNIKLSHYIWATFVFMAPGAIAYTYLGYVGREALGDGQGIIQKSLIALALLAAVAFIPRFIKRLRNKEQN